jgi:hypothetical protein
VNFKEYYRPNLIKEQQMGSFMKPFMGPGSQASGSQNSYYITPRQVLYRRYSKDVADDMIRKVREAGKSAELEKKYYLPDYSDESLDRLVPVIIKDLSHKNLLGYYQFGGQNPYMAIHSGQEPDIQELKHHTRPQAPRTKNFAVDALGHETSHALQNKHDMPAVILGTPVHEIAPVMGDMKRWYFQQTGIALDANMSDAQYDQFLKYMEDNNVFETVPYSRDIDFRKILNSEEGKNAFKRVVRAGSTASSYA